MATWQIQGESGKTLDNTVRSLSDINAASAVLTFRSCGADTLVMSLRLDDFTSTTNIPELTQSVTVTRDGSTFFYGKVTGSEPSVVGGSQTILITVTGPWWFAEHIPLLSSQTDGTGQSAERLAYRPATGAVNMQTAIQGVITRSIAVGVPWQLGTVSSYFDVPQITLTEKSCAQAIAELVQLVPDAMTWVDYSTSPPTINVTRRGSATTRTITLGSDDVAELKIRPVLQLQVSQVRVPYVDRASNGRARWREQSDGTPATGKVGIHTVSGPELDTFLPKDEFDSVQLQTIPTNTIGGNLLNYLKGVDPVLVQLTEKYGPEWYGNNAIGNYLSGLFGSDGESLPYHASQPSSSTPPSFQPTVGASFVVGNAPLSGTKYLILDDSKIPEWLTSENGVTVYEATLSMDVYVRLEWKNPPVATQPSFPGLIEFAGFCWDTLQNYYNEWGNFYNRVSYFIYKADRPVKLIDTAYPSLTTIYRASDYTFVSPPANFAANLLAAQNWLPFEGGIVLQGDETGDTRYRGCKVNVASSRPEHTSMGALVESEELDLLSNVTTINLGAPPRINYRTFIDKIRHTPQDNITYVT